MADLRDIEQIPLEALALSTRAYNALKRGGIKTIQRLLQMSDEEILDLRNVGPVVLAEIRAQLEQWRPMISQPEMVISELQNNILSSKANKETLSIDSISSPSNSEQIPIEALGLSIRPYNALKRKDIETVQQLASLSEEEIGMIRNIGAKSIAEIQDKLAAFNPGSWSPPESAVLQPKINIPKPLLEKSFVQIFEARLISLDTLLLERLGLPESVEIALKYRTIQTLGDLARQPKDSLPEETTILRQFRAYLNWLLKQDQAAQTAEMANQGISPMHLPVLKETSLVELVGKWLSVLPYRAQQVIRLRYGLDNDDEWTLEQVGQHFKITRERIRQIEKKSLLRLNVLPSREVMQPLHAWLMHQIAQAGGLINETNLIELLTQELSVEGVNPVGVIRLVLSLDDRVKWFKEIRSWGLPSQKTGHISGVQKWLVRLLHQERVPLAVDELIARFKMTPFYQKHQTLLSDEFILLYLNQCPAILTGDDGSGQSGLCRLKKWEKRNRIVLALREIGRPAHYSEITQALNRSQQGMQVKPNSLHAYIQRFPDIFIWVERGTYGLAEWGLERSEFYADIVERVLRECGHPLTIQETLMRVCEVRDCKESTVLMLLTLNPRFRAFPGNVYGLAEWEQDRSDEAEPVLPFCPAPLPDPPDQPNAFFESVLIAREILQKPCDTTIFLHTLTEWASLSWPQSRWVCQGVLSTYYMVGAIPYVFYAESESQSLSLTLPDVDLPALREYCLDMLSKRLQAMSEFWWLLQRYQPIQASELAQFFVTVHPLKLDDVVNRLNLLTSIGAVLKSSYGDRYQLTHLGEVLAERWARQPESIDTMTGETLPDDEWDFAELSFE